MIETETLWTASLLSLLTETSRGKPLGGRRPPKVSFSRQREEEILRKISTFSAVPNLIGGPSILQILRKIFGGCESVRSSGPESGAVSKKIAQNLSVFRYTGVNYFAATDLRKTFFGRWFLFRIDLFEQGRRRFLRRGNDGHFASLSLPAANPSHLAFGVTANFSDRALFHLSQ